ncbi:MAG: hypothetical protein AAFY33_07005, partial [Cyanobacteria bacterium J06643_4]
MPFTISPAEAQAIQEDEAQLLNAIAQIAQRVPGIFRESPNAKAQPSTDALRIKMGRRLVYGQLADGPFRHELDANSLKVISDALQQPVTPGINPEKYLRKVPAIEIFHGGVLLFREERDGVVTANEIHFEIEEQATQGDQNNRAEIPAVTVPPVPISQDSVSQDLAIEPEEQAEAIPVESTIEKDTAPNNLKNDTQSDHRVAAFRAYKLLTTAQYLLNPLRQPEVVYDEVSVRGYQIKRRADDIIISNGDSDVLHARNGEIVSSHIGDLDWVVLSEIQIPERLAPPLLNDPPKSAINDISSEGAVLKEIDTVALEPDTADTPSAISVLERETQNLPASVTRQLLKATVQDWKQQVSQRLSQRFQQGVSWLSHQQTALKNQRLAHAVHQLFERGYERTGEQSYHVKDCTIEHKGQNLYVLKDAVGELMQFKTSKGMGFGRRMTLLSVSDRLTSHQRQNLLDNQLDVSVMPQGSLDVEAAYVAKTQKVEMTVRQFLTEFAHAHTWNRENGQFKMEIGEGDLLRITDKQDGRGVVFERSHGEVSSKLNGQDFAHFERLLSKMQGMTAQTKQSTNGKFA